MIGRTIGNYVVTQKLGEGGMGAVYLAEHPRIKRMVAIKVLLPELGKNEQAVARFFTEARAANEIHNEHIIDIIDFGELEDGANYIIMEFLDGQSLADVLDKEPRLPLSRAIHIAKGIGRALAAAHSHGIVHRDLKPDNVYLLKRQGDDNFVKVLDFGIAKLMPSALHAGVDVKTQTGALIGTPLYMSPEQCRGVQIDHRADIYALGVMTYQMVTGRLPFNAEGLGQLLLLHMTEPPPKPRSIDPNIPESVELALLHALEKDPEARFSRVDAFLDALSEVHTGAHAILDPTRPMLVATAAPTEIVTAARNDTLSATSAESIAVSPAPKSKTLVFGIAGVLAVGAIAIGAIVTRKPPQSGTEVTQVITPSPSPSPSAQPSPPPTVPAVMPTAPTQIQPAVAKVFLRTTPPDAVITLDDAQINNPFEGSFPRNDTRHRLVVKAKGFRTESSWVTFDEDRDIAIALVRGSGVHESTTNKIGSKPAPVAQDTPGSTAPKEKEKVTDPGEPTYKGTKGKLITTFPE